MANHKQDNLVDRLTHGAPLAVLLALAIFLAYELLAVLELIAIAMLVALVLRTIVRGLERLGAPPWLAVVILLGMFVGFAALVHWVIVPRLVQEATRRIPNGASSMNAVTDLLRSVPFINPSHLLQRIENHVSQIIGVLPALVTHTASALAAAVVGLFLSIYMAVSPGSLIDAVLRIVPGDRRNAVTEFLECLGRRLRGWIVGTLVVACFVGVGAGIGLWLLGVPLPLTFGLIAGILDVIPYLGSVIGAVLPALVALTISPAKAIEVVALFIVLNQIESHVLQPQIMGREVDLHPALELVAFLVFGELLGLVGAFLAIPEAVLIGTLVDELTEAVPTRKQEDATDKTESGD
jgi:predicted PurR-regulated permease PerM